MRTVFLLRDLLPALCKHSESKRKADAHHQRKRNQINGKIVQVDRAPVHSHAQAHLPNNMKIN